MSPPATQTRSSATGALSTGKAFSLGSGERGRRPCPQPAEPCSWLSGGPSPQCWPLRGPPHHPFWCLYSGPPEPHPRTAAPGGFLLGGKHPLKVFHKLCFCISEADICKVVANMPGAMEPILCALRAKVEEGALGGSPASKAGQRPPGPSADGPWAELAGHRCAAEPSSPLVLWGRKTPPTQWPLENMGCTCPSQDMAGWPWEAPDHGVQQLLEVKEQALAILQETVKILQMKVARLEQLVKLKDLRIRELAGHADKAQ
ncbi:uncharacterized protein LOC126059740 isoform X9 [Elephas maximus indicus]|uniref:uncharacterized protein LOC126059740 isoform X9 n=1 Tax=Elephas maximus indicus TaxID=99487 RepID=UPI002115E37A|nr:uncharacterized protein LOC126059740 isoform X9 [Elephas maximus indicus]